MPLENRIVVCDICGVRYEEEDFGRGFPGWCIISGIGAVTPAEGSPIRKRHTETITCPKCTEQVSMFINELQAMRGSQT